MNGEAIALPLAQFTRHHANRYETLTPMMTNRGDLCTAAIAVLRHPIELDGGLQHCPP